VIVSEDKMKLMSDVFAEIKEFILNHPLVNKLSRSSIRDLADNSFCATYWGFELNDGESNKVYINISSDSYAKQFTYDERGDQYLECKQSVNINYPCYGASSCETVIRKAKFIIDCSEFGIEIEKILNKEPYYVLVQTKEELDRLEKLRKDNEVLSKVMDFVEANKTRKGTTKEFKNPIESPLLNGFYKASDRKYDYEVVVSDSKVFITKK
jgi:hypothetical protein